MIAAAILLGVSTTALQRTVRVTTSANTVCPNTVRVTSGVSVYQGGIVSATENATTATGCCSLCLNTYKDECVAWEFINISVDPHADHNCDIFAKAGPVRSVPGRTIGIVSAPPAPPAPPGPPPPPQVGTPCHSDSDCEQHWDGPNWRCLERAAILNGNNSCHMHATTKNTTCACQPSACNGGFLAVEEIQTNITTRLYVIGDSISMGMQPYLEKLLTADNWSLQHNPGNGDNSNYGAHCVPTWISMAPIKPYDVISFQFGLHDIAYDEERLSIDQYTLLLTNITSYLVSIQHKFGTKLLWVKTTPVPTVPTYGHGCNGTATVCLNPARYDRDVVEYNAAADSVIAAAVAKGAHISTADLYSFVLSKCGGRPGYASCPGFQLPMNVHYTPEGWTALAGEMHRILLSL